MDGSAVIRRVEVLKVEETARDYLEQKDLKDLTGEEHIALALYTIVDALGEYLGGAEDEDDEYDD